MEYYIETGLSGRKRYKLHEITPYNLPNLKNQPLNKDWIPFAIKIMDDLAVDFNSYKFFCDVLKNTPPRFRFFALNEAVLDLCKLLDERRNNKLALSNILGNIYLNITEDKMKQEFILFQNSIESWLSSKSEFIKILKTIRDKLIAHQDIANNDFNELKDAMNKLNTEEFIEVANITIEILCHIIEAVENARTTTDGYYTFNELNIIHDCLVSLEKINKNIIRKNNIIWEIDAKLNELKTLI